MKKYFVLAFLMVAPIVFADTLPPYIQVQVDNINEQITQLKSQRDEMAGRIKNMQSDKSVNKSFAQQELQTQIDNIDKHVLQLEKQKASLQMAHSK